MPGYGDFAYFYDTLNTEAEYEKRAEYIHKLLLSQGADKGILLDLGCGTGTMCELFAKKGYEIIGVDASEDMLNIAQQKKMESGIDAIYLCQKMQEIDMFGTVDCCICTLDCINHLTDEKDVQKTFELVSLFMNDGGCFVFDVNTPFKHKHILGNNTFVYETDEVFCTWQNSFDESILKVDIKLDIFEKDEEDPEVYYRTEEEFSERAYTVEQLSQWLEKADFEIRGIYNEFTTDEVKDTDQRAVFVCVRKNRG